jgi:hypothetical protein
VGAGDFVLAQVITIAGRIPGFNRVITRSSISSRDSARGGIVSIDLVAVPSSGQAAQRAERRFNE